MNLLLDHRFEPPRSRLFRCRAVALVLLTIGGMMVWQPVVRAAPETKPYDAKIVRLSEILGAVHYLRELCGSGDGQIWRKQMQSIIKAEGSSALRRARLTNSFNKGYRSYSRTYNACTPSAKTAIERFIVEGVEIADGLVKSVP